MQIAIIGSGFIGNIIGRALVDAGHEVTFGSRQIDEVVESDTTARVVSVAEAIASSEIVILAIPGSAVGQLGAEYSDALAGKLVIDATNKMSEPVSNSRSALPSSVHYVRAFNTLGGETLENPTFPDGKADLFFSAPTNNRATVETIIEGVGLRPIYVGEDQEALVDALFQLWIELALRQGRGRHLALRLLEDR